MFSPHALYMHGLGRFGLVPSLRGGLVWGLGGGESPRIEIYKSIKALRVRVSKHMLGVGLADRWEELGVEGGERRDG
jgi:hypothetical protein